MKNQPTNKRQKSERNARYMVERRNEKKNKICLHNIYSKSLLMWRDSTNTKPKKKKNKWFSVRFYFLQFCVCDFSNRLLCCAVGKKTLFSYFCSSFFIIEMMTLPNTFIIIFVFLLRSADIIIIIINNNKKLNYIL